MNPAGQNRFYDIAPPGQTIPPTSGRPIIVSNRPEQTDQMLQSPPNQPQYQMPQVNQVPPSTGSIYSRVYEQPIPESPPTTQPNTTYEQVPAATVYEPAAPTTQPNTTYEQVPAATVYAPMPTAVPSNTTYEQVPAATGIYAPTPTAVPPNYGAPAVDYSQPQPPMVAPAYTQINPAIQASSPAASDQPHHSVIKSIIWLALLLFALWLIFDVILDWEHLKFLPHTHLIHK